MPAEPGQCAAHHTAPRSGCWVQGEPYGMHALSCCKAQKAARALPYSPQLPHLERTTPVLPVWLGAVTNSTPALPLCSVLHQPVLLFPLYCRHTRTAPTPALSPHLYCHHAQFSHLHCAVVAGRALQLLSQQHSPAVPGPCTDSRRPAPLPVHTVPGHPRTQPGALPGEGLVGGERVISKP